MRLTQGKWWLSSARRYASSGLEHSAGPPLRPDYGKLTNSLVGRPLPGHTVFIALGCSLRRTPNRCHRSNPAGHHSGNHRPVTCRSALRCCSGDHRRRCLHNLCPSPVRPLSRSFQIVTIWRESPLQRTTNTPYPLPETGSPLLRCVGSGRIPSFEGMRCAVGPHGFAVAVTGGFGRIGLFRLLSVLRTPHATAILTCDAAAHRNF